MADSGKILSTFRPFPTQNARTPPPAAYIRPTAPHRLASADVAFRRGFVAFVGRALEKKDFSSVVMR